MSINKTAVKTMDILELFYEHEEPQFNRDGSAYEYAENICLSFNWFVRRNGVLQKMRREISFRVVFLRFGQLVSQRLSVRNIAIPYMKELRDSLGQAVNLIIQDGNDAIYVEKMEGVQPVRVYTAVGRRAPLYAGACPRILLSYFSEEKKRKYIEETNLKQFADGTIVDKKQLLEVLQMAKKEGHTISYSELENHTAAIAAPIFANDGTVVAGISISGLAIEYSESNISYFIAKVKETANRISKELGFWHRKRE